MRLGARLLHVVPSQEETMSQRSGKAPKAGAEKQRKRKPADRGDEGRRPAESDALDVTWDQPQPRYPAPERPPDRAEERKRSA
jgi:hypothetical protein